MANRFHALFIAALLATVPVMSASAQAPGAQAPEAVPQAAREVDGEVDDRGLGGGAALAAAVALARARAAAGSLKAPETVIRSKVLLNTSILPLKESAA